ncbi:hypothetical protein [Demequina zhanjiangensis]|uniref:Uncharacterized protein n=1 Tax=Demequina zhanjiangensis TaxID=3051659 RepID=A0ABT8FYD7_9MICO|nr:hypothetical protein [Demequina sp. SYSU T00b26]MDN4471837.1 hypothetical protein [Demequina sp. SYSU T00b26]
MHRTAKRCLWWAAGLAGLGALWLAYGTDIVLGFQRTVGANAEPALYAFGYVSTLVHSLAMPLAAALVGAAIVIQTLAPKSAADD